MSFLLLKLPGTRLKKIVEGASVLDKKGIEKGTEFGTTSYDERKEAREKASNKTSNYFTILYQYHEQLRQTSPFI